MRKYLRKKLAKLLTVAVFMSLFSVNAMAKTVPRINMGTFYVVSGSSKSGGSRDDTENDRPKNGDPEDGSSSANRPGSSEESENSVSGNGKDGVSGDFIAQTPADSDLITEPRTVVPTKTKWRITPSFNVVRASSSDRRAVKASKKRDKARSSPGSKWNCGFIAVKKPGTVTITLEGAGGEKEEYLIYAENPKIKKDALVINDVKTISMDTYLSGITYLKPTRVESKKPDIATVSENGSISVKANGKSKVTLFFGKRKVKGNVKALLPAFVKKKVIIKDKPVKLAMKNVSNNSAVQYSSSDISVVKMNKDGYAAPVANGTTTVFGKSGNVTAECEVTVRGLK
ncbi:MAG: hypothetical protein IJT63_01660 [Lachnospiraceae bacterium]|nr:hypothetical protein [Lachnospiraceae bacterium]